MKLKKQTTLKELQSLWDQKLAKDGFQDIENRDGTLKSWASFKFQLNYDPIKAEAKEEYYQRAGQFLYSYKFDSKEEKFMWTEHQQGVGIRDIVIKLKKKGVNLTRYKVHGILNKLSKIMLSGRNEKE